MRYSFVLVYTVTVVAVTLVVRALVREFCGER